jgi:hypothetical protein
MYAGTKDRPDDVIVERGSDWPDSLLASSCGQDVFRFRHENSAYSSLALRLLCFSGFVS